SLDCSPASPMLLRRLDIAVERRPLFACPPEVPSLRAMLRSGVAQFGSGQNQLSRVLSIDHAHGQIF
ncbi:hypothetical protein B8X04_16985, partial [Brevibacterium casei]